MVISPEDSSDYEAAVEQLDMEYAVPADKSHVEKLAAKVGQDCERLN